MTNKVMVIKMTENKQFDTYFDDYMQLWTVSDNENDNMLYPCTSENMANEFAQLLNELNDENKELKDKYNEQSVSYEGLEEQVERLLDFKDKVFNLINGKIKLYSHKPVSAPISQPLSVNFDADMDRLARLSELEALKEELQE